jgi:hypothetical protein
MNSLDVAKRRPKISKKWETAPGQIILVANPPNQASIWSARMTDTARVMSAWRSS